MGNKWNTKLAFVFLLSGLTRNPPHPYFTVHMCILFQLFCFALFSAGNFLSVLLHWIFCWICLHQQRWILHDSA
jgi:hypothetical protein